jgi:hypothetical protein
MKRTNGPPDVTANDAYQSSAAWLLIPTSSARSVLFSSNALLTVWPLTIVPNATAILRLPRRDQAPDLNDLCRDSDSRGWSSMISDDPGRAR